MCPKWRWQYWPVGCEGIGWFLSPFDSTAPGKLCPKVWWEGSWGVMAGSPLSHNHLAVSSLPCLALTGGCHGGEMAHCRDGTLWGWHIVGTCYAVCLSVGLRVPLPLAALIDPQRCEASCSHRPQSDSGQEKQLGPWKASSPRHASPCVLSLHCFVDALVTAVCILKGIYIKCLVGLKIQATSSRGEKSTLKAWHSFLSGGDGRAPIQLYSFVQTIISTCRTQGRAQVEVLARSSSLPFSSHPDSIQRAWGLHLWAPSAPCKRWSPGLVVCTLRAWFTAGTTRQTLSILAEISGPQVSTCSVHAWVVLSAGPCGLLGSFTVGGVGPEWGPLQWCVGQGLRALLSSYCFICEMIHYGREKSSGHFSYKWALIGMIKNTLKGYALLEEIP